LKLNELWTIGTPMTGQNIRCPSQSAHFPLLIIVFVLSKDSFLGEIEMNFGQWNEGHLGDGWWTRGKAICGGGNCANGNFEWMDSANSGWICPMLIHRGMGQINFASNLTLLSRTPIILFLDYVKNNLIVEVTPEREMTKTVDDGHKWAI